MLTRCDVGKQPACMCMSDQRRRQSWHRFASQCRQLIKHYVYERGTVGLTRPSCRDEEGHHRDAVRWIQRESCHQRGLARLGRSLPVYERFRAGTEPRQLQQLVLPLTQVPGGDVTHNVPVSRPFQRSRRLPRRLYIGQRLQPEQRQHLGGLVRRQGAQANVQADRRQSPQTLRPVVISHDPYQLPAAPHGSSGHALPS